ncbi:MAG: carboxypeptidase-like regulatory domain-containing protein [Demequina sp.]|nr:carboxypeptidase-like regulatory domain-containing protein [Demequina sp.]
MTNFDGFSATDCALPGDSTYAVPAPSGLYKIEFYAEGPGVATEWYPNKITGGEGEWVRMDYEDTTVNAVLAAAGTIQGFVSGPGGALSSGGCVSVFTVAGLFVDMNCPADGDPFVFNSLTPGSYELQFTGFEGLGSAWSGGTGFGQTRQVSVAAGATTTFNMELSAAAVVTGTVDYSGEPAVGGCVDVVDTSGYTVSTACVDSNGVYTIDDAPGGVVYLHFRGFDGAANEWTGESSSFAKATAVHLHSGSTTTIDATLGRGGTISGEVSEFNGGVFTVFLRALDGSLVDWYSLGGDSYSATFGFNNVPQGRYKLTVIANGTTYETPYRASGAISPAIVSMPTASGWDLTGLNWNTEYDTAGAISGRFNVPSSWKSSTICALAITPKGGVQSADCGARGGRFDLTRLAPDQVYAILFTNGDVHTRAQLKAFKGAKLYYGNTTSLTNALFYRTTVNQAPYLPVWFYKDVSHKTVNIEAIEWLGDQNIYRPSANTFRPESTMTRRDLAMYLYKMAGSPAVAIPSRSPFSDVKTTDAGYKAVLWLRSTKVWTSTAFKPGAGLDKKTEALILYRVAGSPKVTLPSKNPYKDIKSSDSAYKAVTWANKYHIVSKSSSTSFGAKSLVKRKYGAASLYEWWWRFG